MHIPKGSALFLNGTASSSAGASPPLWPRGTCERDVEGTRRRPHLGLPPSASSQCRSWSQRWHSASPRSSSGARGASSSRPKSSASDGAERSRASPPRSSSPRSCAGACTPDRRGRGPTAVRPSPSRSRCAGPAGGSWTSWACRTSRRATAGSRLCKPGPRRRATQRTPWGESGRIRNRAKRCSRTCWRVGGDSGAMPPLRRQGRRRCRRRLSQTLRVRGGFGQSTSEGASIWC
mmetsp:Transcript_656/g.932  ORF Transcript_656/g.932 Transcript_656/m.932 type:complete len:234 (-) Transcript_656:278-979(-)